MLETVSWEMVLLPPLFSCLRKCSFCSWKTTQDARENFLGDGGASTYIFLSSENPVFVVENYARCSRQFLGRWWWFHLYFLIFGNAVFVGKNLREMFETISWEMVVLPPIFSCLRKCCFCGWKNTRDDRDSFLGDGVASTYIFLSSRMLSL